MSARCWHPTQVIEQGADGSVVLSFTCANLAPVVSWVLEWGPHARVTEPADLVDLVITELDQAELALTLATLDEMEPLLASACPPLASLSACQRQLPARTKQLLLPGMFIDKAADEMRAVNKTIGLWWLWLAPARRHLQSELTHKAAVNQLGGYSFYVERAARDVSRLVALRVEIEILRGKTCHVPMDLLSPDVLGEPVRFTTLKASLRIEPPTWATSDTRPIESWTFECP